jgi:hypothetical protein
MAGDVTVDEILDELATAYHVEERRPDDVDAKQLAERMGVSERQAGNVMKRIVKERADYVRVWVYDPPCHRWVLRKVEA